MRARLRAVVVATALTVAALAIGLGGRAARAEGPSSEYALKAAFLYNFAKFVDWPESQSPGAVFCIGIVGADPFGPTIDAMLRDKVVHDKRIVVRRFATVGDAASCEMVFFAGAGRADARSLGGGALTVVEEPDVATVGAVIGFTMDGNKLRFVIDAGCAERRGLKISSQLLKLAVRVVKDVE